MLGGDGSLILQLVTGLLLAGAVYGGIRSDLRQMRRDISRVERVSDKAHDRIDLISGGVPHRRQGDD